MRKGILRVLIFYAIGFGIAGLVNWFFGSTYDHVVKVHHYVLMLMVFIGIAWSFVNLFKFVFIFRDRVSLGILISNFMIISILCVYSTM